MNKMRILKKKKQNEMNFIPFTCRYFNLLSLLSFIFRVFFNLQVWNRIGMSNISTWILFQESNNKKLGSKFVTAEIWYNLWLSYSSPQVQCMFCLRFRLLSWSPNFYTCCQRFDDTQFREPARLQFPIFSEPFLFSWVGTFLWPLYG